MKAPTKRDPGLAEPGQQNAYGERLPQPQVVPRSAERFAWWPVPLSEFRDGYWYRTGEQAWLEKVSVKKTIWGDILYVRPNA
jgi:hypothetical protein